MARAAAIVAAAAGTTFVVDRLAARAVEQRLAPGERARGPLGIELVRRSNAGGIAGTAPGSAASTGLLVGGGVLALGIGAGAAMVRRPWPVQVGAGMVVGAMVSNLLARASGDHAVTDYLPTPLGVVNAADAALGAGIVLAGTGMLLR